jgi:serine/threonine protein kinase
MRNLGFITPSKGVVHRDIKLNNILLAPERHVYLSDFGISKIRDEKLRTDVDVTYLHHAIPVTQIA